MGRNRTSDLHDDMSGAIPLSYPSSDRTAFPLTISQITPLTIAAGHMEADLFISSGCSSHISHTRPTDQQFIGETHNGQISALGAG